MHNDDELLQRMLKSFTNVTPEGDQIQRIESIRDEYKALLSNVISLIDNNRERALAITHLENSLMYAVKAIVLE